MANERPANEGTLREHLGAFARARDEKRGVIPPLGEGWLTSKGGDSHYYRHGFALCGAWLLLKGSPAPYRPVVRPTDCPACLGELADPGVSDRAPV